MRVINIDDDEEDEGPEQSEGTTGLMGNRP